MFRNRHNAAPAKQRRGYSVGKTRDSRGTLQPGAGARPLAIRQVPQPPIIVPLRYGLLERQDRAGVPAIGKVPVCDRCPTGFGRQSKRNDRLLLLAGRENRGHRQTAFRNARRAGAGALKR